MPQVRTCRQCGCTEERACAGGCWWVDTDLCSACQPAKLDGESTTMVHVCGPCITFGHLRRQRCSWCGFVIVDDDLSRMAVAIAPCRRCGVNYMHGEHDDENGYCVVGNEVRQPHDFETPSAPGGFPFEQFVEITMAGGFRGTSVIEVDPDGNGMVKVPHNCCMSLPPELTGEKESHIGPADVDSVDPS